MRVLFSALSLALALPLTQGAELSLTDFTCASGYPVEVLSFLFECSGSSCTFGDTANFTGWFNYNNLTTEYADITAEVQLSGYSYTLLNETIDLCYNASAVDGGDCGNDNGEYIVEFDRSIPSTGFGQYDWFFTGFSLKTHISLTTTSGNYTETLGDCYATLKTQTTSQVNVKSNTYSTPSAAVTFILVGATLLTALLVKGLTGGKSSEADDDKNTELITKSVLKGPDEIERARSAFAEELPWPKASNREGILA